ncbi:30S ribosomal protein S9 [Candidatus Gottesmanbacteria bacterium]|nr:30S ribosomal protein S9 [Candidatus Gottesmanbacteria bacterium]
MEPKPKSEFYQAVGRRKESTARVRLTISPKELMIKGKSYKKGDIVVNDIAASDYFRGKIYPQLYTHPFKITETQGRFITTVKVEGGGISGQLQAMMHGIARSLEKIDKEKYRPILKREGLLKRDPRTKERRKAGFAQKARAKKQSPKR